jgi:hypothetical protein
MEITTQHYLDLVNGTLVFTQDEPLILFDHLGGFDANFKNRLLDVFLKNKCKNQIYTQYQIDFLKLSHYNTLNIKNYAEFQNRLNFKHFVNYTIHPTLNYKNFICSFNGSPHVSRKLLVSILSKFGYFNNNYCSKNFSYTKNMLNGHITDYVNDQDNFYLKFFVNEHSEEFFQSTNSFGHVRFEHNQNIHNLESKLTESFLHIVSETAATSYYPFVTEKFLYSIVTRGLFLAYAQPGWHAHVEKYHGFKRYTKLFDYRFDSIKNPVERLVELITMISKFSHLTPAEWHDLYLIEQDTIEYNYDHYFSNRYLEVLKKHD